MTQPIKLAAKIAKVMEAVGYVAKTGTNSAQGYKFVQASAVADKVREQLSKLNVSMTPTQGRDHLVPVGRHWCRLRRQGGI